MAAKRVRRRRCEFCRELFRPDPRVGARQRACSTAGCQRDRRRASQEAWLATDPEYFRRRATEHVRYRREIAAGDRTPTKRSPKIAEQVKQDERLTQVVSVQAVAADLPCSREQDARPAQVVFLPGLAACLTPFGAHPEQDEMDARLGAWELLGRRVLAGATQRPPRGDRSRTNVGPGHPIGRAGRRGRSVHAHAEAAP